MNLIKKLPDPFLFRDSRRVATEEDWSERRNEIIDLMMETQYGTMPDAPKIMTCSIGQWELNEYGRRTRVDRLEFAPNREKTQFSFTLDTTLTHPSEETIARRVETDPSFGETGLPCVIYVGSKAHDTILDNGYVVVNYPNDVIEPMEIGNPQLGPARRTYQQLYKETYRWGSISAWAWGARRVLDHITRLADLDASRVAITGHSRNGKTALLAGAIDERFGVVNPAGSGCAGAGSYLAVGEGCEDLAALTSRERWWAWTQEDFDSWAGKEDQLPFDQHFLMALVAPRPLLRTEGIDDHWANPEGTSVSYLATQPVYDFLGVPTANTISYREGGHEHTEEDVAFLMDLCDETFYGIERRTELSSVLPQTPSLDQIIDWSTPERT